MSAAGMKDIIKEYQKMIADELKKKEEQIYDTEGKYLEESTAYGTARA